jgi:putative heme transporter
MTSPSQAEPTSRASPQQRSRRRPAVRWIVHGIVFVVLAVGVFGLLPRLGGLTRDAAALRHGRLAFMVAAAAAQAVSLACYTELYRRLLGALGAKVRFRLAADVTLASFLVSHITPLGSATGTLVNVTTLEEEGVSAATTGEAIALTSLMSTVALIALFGCGFAATAGRHLAPAYLITAGIALVLVAAALAAVLVVGAHPAVAARAGHWAATVARRFRPGIDPDRAAATASRLASLARSTLTGRAFWPSFGLATADLLTDLLSLDLMFLAFGYQPGFGPLAVAYAAANIASAIPLTPGGLGVVEVTLVAITVGFGAARPTAVTAAVVRDL